MGSLSRGVRRQWLSLILGVILAGLALNLAWGSPGIRDLLILRQHAQALTGQRDQLARDNAVLLTQIARLHSDDEYLQRLIRQQLGFVRPGELVYRFPKQPH